MTIWIYWGWREEEENNIFRVEEGAGGVSFLDMCGIIPPRDVFRIVGKRRERERESGLVLTVACDVWKVISLVNRADGKKERTVGDGQGPNAWLAGLESTSSMHPTFFHSFSPPSVFLFFVPVGRSSTYHFPRLATRR